MATHAKTNGQRKNETATTKAAIQKKLVEQATGKMSEPANKEVIAQLPVTLDERINRFEKLRGITSQRERVVHILTELARFNYNSSESCTFFLRDMAGLEFKTTNTNLIRIVAGELQKTLEAKKAALEKQLMEFTF